MEIAREKEIREDERQKTILWCSVATALILMIGMLFLGEAAGATYWQRLFRTLYLTAGSFLASGMVAVVYFASNYLRGMWEQKTKKEKVYLGIFYGIAFIAIYSLFA